MQAQKALSSIRKPYLKPVYITGKLTVLRLLRDGLTKVVVAEKAGIGVASVYRIAKAAKVLQEKKRGKTSNILT